MITSTERLPGVEFAAIRTPSAELPLRTDVGVFAGRTLRGPLAEAVRVEGWRQFTAVFGGLSATDVTSYAVKGYFECGGEVAWIWRVGGGPAAPATALWDVGADAGVLGLRASRYVVAASSPGAWGNRVQVSIELRRRPVGRQAVDIVVSAGDEPAERLLGVPCDDLSAAVAERSTYVRFSEDLAPPVGAPGLGGPLTRRWTLRLANGVAPRVDRAAYDRAVEAAVQLDEPALFALPDLAFDLGDDAQRTDVLAAAAVDCSDSLDRLLLVDLPERFAFAADADVWLSNFGDREVLRRSAAAYHPWIAIADPLGSAAEPQRNVPPSGHVMGVISRLDRERGAAVTPANASLEGVVDLARGLAAGEQAGLYALGVNALACQSGRGVVIWGGRMLGGGPIESAARDIGFVAHRRLIHRLVRAIHQTVRPLVFEVNGPRLWFGLTRGATTVLLEAWRARALQGTRPEEAFRVRCDAELNGPEVIERGQVVCEISLAPAAPLEFITLRVALSGDGQLEVAEA